MTRRTNTSTSTAAVSVAAVPASAIVLSVLIHTLWGGNVVAGKFGLEAFPPFWSACIRFLFGIATVWCWCLYTRRRLLPESHEWRPLLLISVYFTVQIGLMNLGFDNTSGTNGAILISTNPLFAAMFAHFIIAGDHLSMKRVFGLLLAFAGVLLTLLVSGSQNAELSLFEQMKTLSFGQLGDWLCLASACLLGFRLMASARAMRKVDSYRLAFWQMVMSVPAFALLGFLFEDISLQAVSLRAIAGLAYQGVVVAGIGFMVSLWLISRYRPSLMASFNFISPVSGVLLSVWLLNENFNPVLLLSVFLVAAGIVVLTVEKSTLARAE